MLAISRASSLVPSLLPSSAIRISPSSLALTNIAFVISIALLILGFSLYAGMTTEAAYFDTVLDHVHH